MKDAALKRTILTLLLVLTVAFLYFQFLTEPVYNADFEKEADDEEVIEEDVPMPDSLHPVVEQRANELVEKAAAKGIRIIITDGFRSIEEQDELYAQGRTKPGKIVTNRKGGESYHNYGLAVDFAIKLSSGRVLWDLKYDGNKNGRPDWFEVAELAKELGFTWGGDWEEFTDYPHLQIEFGLTIEDLQNGKRPPAAEDYFLAEKESKKK